MPTNTAGTLVSIAKACLAIASFAWMAWLLRFIFNPSLFPHQDAVLEKDYGVNCAFSSEHIWDRIDIFILAHAGGYAIAYFLSRNFLLALFVSITFELVELTYYTWLPNFKECWWDTLFLDSFGCNLLGVLTGWIIFKILNIPTYRFFPWEAPSPRDKLNPGPITAGQAFVGLLYFTMLTNGMLVTNFFLKFLWRIPSTDPRFAAHALYISAMFLFADKEFYLHVYMGKPGFIWTALTLVVFLLEVGVVFVGSQTAFKTSIPLWVYPMWITLWATVAGILYLNSRVAFFLLIAAQALGTAYFCYVVY